MISRRRLMLIRLGDINQHYDSDGNGYDVEALSISNLLVQPSSDTDKDSENLGISNLLVEPSSDTDKDSENLVINITITLESV